MTDREEQLKQIIRQMLMPLRNIPLDIIIETITEGKYTIWPYDGFAFDILEKIADESLLRINKVGISSKRPNEVGNYCESYVQSAINCVAGNADKPRASSGKVKAVGYPDLYAEISGRPFYFEVKTYSKKTSSTTQRSFYLSPSEDFKITKNAYHIIIAFQMSNIGQQNGVNIYKAEACTLIDAHNLPCDVKFEFNSDNRRLYGDEEAIIMRRIHPLE